MTDNKQTLWIFGHSFCLPFGLIDSDLGWANILSKKISADIQNFAEAGSDNLFIYHTYLAARPQITSSDIVIIGWSHPSRKSFIFDQHNPNHVSIIDKGLRYKTKTHDFFRSNNPSSMSVSKYKSLKPMNRGLKFYDDWFKNYYNEYEQSCNFQAYLDSVKLTCPGKYIPFYFSNESIKDVTITDSGCGSMVEFISDHQVMISDQETHMNETGHQLWAEHLYKIINNTQPPN